MSNKALEYGLIEFTPQQQEVRRLAREFAQTHIHPVAARIDREDNIPRDLWSKFGSPPYSFIGVCVPQKYGGRGLGMLEISLVIEEIAYESLSVATLLEVSTIAPLVIIKAGAEHLMDKYLRPLTSGNFWLGIMLTDEQSGSDPADMRTTAEETPQGFVLNGTKRLISFADQADGFVVFAKTAPGQRRRSISAFVVEKGFPGFKIDRRQRCFGMGGHRTWECRFQNCIVPKENLIGEKGGGFRYMLMTLDDSRATLAAGHLGIAERALDLAVEYAKRRIVFEKTLSEYQMVTYPLADLATEIEAARFLIYNASLMADKGMWHKKEANMAKAFAAQLAVKATLLAVRVMGGEGVTDAYPAERLLRDAVTFQFAQGAIDIQKFVVVRELFGQS